MKKFLFFLALILIVSCNNPKGTIPQLKNYGFKGKIESIKEKSYYAQDDYGKIITNKIKNAKIIEFNTLGFASKISTFNEYGDRRNTEKLSYNDKGEFISSKSTYATNFLSQEYSLTYRDKDKAKFKAKYDAYIIYTYKDLTATKYNRNGEVQTVVKYNNKGQILEKIEYNNNEVNYRCVNNYNSKNLLESETYYNSEGNIEYVTHYQYEDFDKKGNPTTELVLDNDYKIHEVVKLEFKYK